MNPTEYMEATRGTIVYDGPAYELAYHVNIPRGVAEKYARLSYCGIKINGEAGELGEEIAKAFRDDLAQITPERLERIIKELGDIAWYWHRICDELNLTPEAVLAQNIHKLQSRKERGVIHGSGSDR